MTFACTTAGNALCVDVAPRVLYITSVVGVGTLPSWPRSMLRMLTQSRFRACSYIHWLYVALQLTTATQLHADDKRNNALPAANSGTTVHSLLPHGFQVSSRINVHADGVTGYLHQGGFCETADGNLICGFPATRRPHDYGGDGLSPASYAWISRDRGRTWSVLETPFADNRLSAYGQGSNPFSLPSGRLLYFGHFPPAEKSYEDKYGPAAFGHMRLMTSLDGGKTWGSFASGGTDWKATEVLGLTADQENLEDKDLVPPTGDRGFTKVGPLTNWDLQLLRSGRLITGLPPSWHEDVPSTTRNTIWWYYSDDEGYHWDLLGAIRRPPTGEALAEPSVVELPDGRLLCLLRCYNHRLPRKRSDGWHINRGSSYYFLAVSDDGGRNWSDPWPCYLGSEMSQGAMAEWCLAGDSIYLVGTFDQYRPPYVPGIVDASYLAKHHAALWNSQYYMQRTPLQVMRIPLTQFLHQRDGAYTLQPDAIRQLAVSIHQDTALESTYSAPQIQVLKNGNLGILCDTHTRGDDRSHILYWEVQPEWFDEGPPQALRRGPLPLVMPNGEVRVLHTQTTIRPTRFPTGQLPITISFTMRPRFLERRQVHMTQNAKGRWEKVQPLFAVWNSGNLTLDTTPYPHAIFLGLDAIGTLTKDGPCQLAVNTGSGRQRLDFPLWEQRDYQVTLTLESRISWSLNVDGTDLGSFTPVCPGLPASYSLAHESFPGHSIDIGYRDLHVIAGAQPPRLLEHPFLLERFRKSRQQTDQWRGDFGHLTLGKSASGWSAEITNPAWRRWLKYGGLIVATDDSGGGSPHPSIRFLHAELPGLEVWDKGSHALTRELDAMGNWHTRRIDFGDTHRVALAASAVHDRVYLCADDRVHRWDEWAKLGGGLNAARGRPGPLLVQAEDTPLTVHVSDHVTELHLVAWDLHPGSALRLLKLVAPPP